MLAKLVGKQPHDRVVRASNLRSQGPAFESRKRRSSAHVCVCMAFHCTELFIFTLSSFGYGHHLVLTSGFIHLREFFFQGQGIVREFGGGGGGGGVEGNEILQKCQENVREFYISA